MRLEIQPDLLEVEASDEETLLAASLRAGIGHFHACGGSGRCSTCRVIILQGGEGLAPRTATEEAMALRLGFPVEIRLACQARLRPGFSGRAVVRRLVLDHEDAHLAADGSEAMRGPVGVEREIAVLFADLRGFSDFASRAPAYDAVHLLRRFFLRMNEAIRRAGGEIDATLGDGLMALFWDPPEDAAHRAIVAGREMLEAAAELSIYAERVFGWPVRIGVGIHWGPAVMGVVWPPERKRPTAIGDTVNVAARIEAATKFVGMPLLVSEAVRDRAPDTSFSSPYEVELAGRPGVVRLYAPRD